MTITLSALQKQRTDTAANWTSANPTLLSGELGFESDTGKVKLGTGSTAWNSLGYLGVIPSNGAYPLSQLLLPLGSQSAPSLTFAGDLNTGIYSPGADQVSVSTGGTGRLFVDSSGNVGVGTSDTANAFLTVTNQDVSLRLNPVTGAASITAVQTGVAFRDLTIGSNQTIFQTGASERLRITSTGALNFVGAGTAGSTQAVSFNGSAPVNSLVIDSTGKVGLGSSSPGANLDIVVGSGTATQKLGSSSVSGGSYLNLHGASTSKTWFIGANYNFAGVLEFTQSTANGGTTPSSTPAMVLSAAGNVGIGTSSPSQLLEVAGSVGNIQLASSGAEITFTRNGPSAITASGASGSLLFQTGGTNERARIDSSGRLLVGTPPSPAYQLQLDTDSAGKPSTNTWTIVSDERIKEEIEFADLDLCYEAVKNIPLKRFKWKDEVYTEDQAYDRRKLGWIAQDVEAVFPKAVRQHEFKYNQVFEEIVIPAVPAELDEDGNVIIEEQPERIVKGELISEEVIEDCRDLNSDQLYAAMYGAIQKLISKVETLEAEIAALKA